MILEVVLFIVSPELIPIPQPIPSLEAATPEPQFRACRRGYYGGFGNPEAVKVMGRVQVL